MQTLQATIDRDGNVRLLEPIRLPAPSRALVTVVDDDGASTAPGIAPSVQASLVEDWDRPEEEEAWSYLQQAL